MEISTFISEIRALNSAGFNGLGFVFSDLAASIGLSTAALGGFMAAAAGLVAVVAIITQVKKAQEEQRKAAEEAAQNFATERQSLDDYVTQIQTLREKLADGSLSEAEAYETKSQLLDIQNQLVETYGAEAAGLDLVTGKYEEQIEAVQNLGKEKAKEFRDNNLDAINRAVDEIEKQREITLSGLPYDEEVNKLIKEKYAGRGVSADFNDRGEYVVTITGDASEAQEVIKDLKTDLVDTFGMDFGSDHEGLITVESASEQLFDSLNSEDKILSEVLEKYQGIYDQWQVAKAVIDQEEYVDESGEEGHSAIKWLNDYADAIEKYNDAWRSGDEAKIKEAKAEFTAIDKTMNYLAAGQMSEYADQIAEVRSELDQTIVSQDKLNEATEESTTLAEARKQLKELGLTDVQAKDAYWFSSDKKNKKAVENIINAAKKVGLISEEADKVEIDGFIDQLVLAGDISEDVSQTLSNVPSSDILPTEKFSTFKEYQSDLATAISESTSATGLSTESIQKLTGAYKDLESFDATKLFELTENGIRLNREELERLNSELENTTLKDLAQDYFDLKDAIEEASAKGEDTTGLENDLAQTQQLIAQYRGLTSAYNDWLAAKSGGNERGSYEDIGKSYDSMKETLDSGWYDDPALQAYLDLMLSAEQRTGDAREDFAKLKQEIGDTGYSLMDFWQYDDNGKLQSTGLRNLLDTINQFDDSIVSVGEDGAYSFDLTGDNLQNVADYLGTSTEMVGLFVKALDDVGDVEFNTGDTDLDAFLNKLFGKETKEVDVDVDDSEVDATNEKIEGAELTENVNVNAETGEAESQIEEITQPETKEVTVEATGEDTSAASTEQDVTVNVKQEPDPLTINVEDATVTVEPDQDEYTVKIADAEFTASPDQEQYTVKISDASVTVTPDKEEYTVNVADTKVTVTPDKESYSVKINDEEVVVVPNQESYDVVINGQTVQVTPDQDGYDVKINDQIVKVRPNQTGYDVDINDQKVTVTPDKDSYDVTINGQTVTVTPELNPETGELTVDVNGVAGDMSGAISEMQTEADSNPIEIEVKPKGGGFLAEGAETPEIEAVEEEVEISGTVVVDEVDTSNLPNETAVDIDANNDSAETAISETETGLSELNGKSSESDINANNSQAESEIQETESDLSSLDSETASPDITADDQASGTISSVSSSLDALNNKEAKTYVTTIHRTVNEGGGGSETSPANGTFGGGGHSFAMGSFSGGRNVSISRSQTALINELGNEGIVRNGRFSIIPGGAQYVNLKKGDIVFNHKQVEELEKNGMVTSGGGHGKIAFSRGTIGAFVKGKNLYFPDSGSSGSGSGSGGSSGSGSGSSGSGSSSSGGKSSSSNSDSKKDNAIDWIERRLNYFADKVKRIADTITDYVTSSVKKAKLIQQRSTIDKQITANEKGYSAYLKEAKKVKLSSKLKKKVRSGDYNINEYDSDTQKAINKYKDYYDKAQDCKDKVTELKNTQLELFEDLMNIPTEKAGKKIDKLKDKFDSLSSALTTVSLGMSGVSQLMSLNADSIQSTKASYTETKDAYSDTSSALKKAKSKLTKKDKKTKKKSDGTYSLKGVKKNSKKYKRLKSYNDALKANKKAKNSYTVAKTTYQQTQSLYDLIGDGTTYSYQNALIDQETANLREQNKANQTALKESNANLAAARSSQSSADSAVASKAKSLAKSKNSKLASRAKSANGGKISTKGLKGNALKQAKAYNKLVETAATKTQELTIAQDAQAEAANNAAQSQAELAEQIVQAEKDKFDNIKTYYEAESDYLDSIMKKQEAANNLKTTKGLSLAASDYQALIDQNNQSIQNLQAEATQLKTQLASAVSSGVIQEGSEEWKAMQGEINAVEEVTTEAMAQQEEYNNAVAQLPFDAIKKQLDYLDALHGYLESERELRKASGQDLSALDYQNKMNEALEKQLQYETERSQAYNNYLQATANSEGVFGGKTAQEWLQQYYDAGENVNKIKTEVEGIKDSLRDDVYWRTFERAHDAAKRFADVLSGIDDLIDDNSLFDKNGNLTDFGVARVANLTKSFETARKEVSNYSNDLANLNSLYSQGFYTELEYQEKLNEIQTGMLDAARNMKSYQDSIIEMYKSIAQSELDALNKLIDARAEALDKKKAYYEYDKNIRKQTDDLQNLQAQLAALEGINSLEANAKRRKLELEIKEAQDELDETVQDHIFDLSKEALDDIKDTLQEAFDDKWDHISGDLDEITTLMGEAKTLTTTGMTSINATLTALLKHYGIDANTSGIDKAFASGTTGVHHRLRALIGEDGSEIATTKEGLIITMNRGDGVLPHEMTENLMQMAQGIVPNVEMNAIRLPLHNGGGYGATNVEQYYDSLIHIDGSADAATVEDIKRMTNDLLSKSYEYTSKKIHNGYMKAGGRRSI